MEENQAGVTALITAYARAYHSTHDNPKIFDDFIADLLYSPEEHQRFDGYLAALLPMIDPELAQANPAPAAALALVMQIQLGPVTLSRSRYTEDRLEEAIRQGVTQYVILGAGMDTFALRRPDLLERIDVFEVDHPTTQAMKRERLARLSRPLPERLHFVPVDFTRQSLAAELPGSGYSVEKEAFFSWLGVTYYLARDVVFATLRDLAGLAAKGSTLVFDYLEATAFQPGAASARTQLSRNIVRQAGEPMKTGFDPAGLSGDLAQAGWRLVENLPPTEIEARYFQGRADRYHASENTYFARCER